MTRKYDEAARRAQHKARSELEEAREWLQSHRALSEPFIQAVDEKHPGIWFGMVMELVAESIEKGNSKAIELGCFYISNDPKAPFGHIFEAEGHECPAEACRSDPDSVPSGANRCACQAQCSSVSSPGAQGSWTTCAGTGDR